MIGLFGFNGYEEPRDNVGGPGCRAGSARTWGGMHSAASPRRAEHHTYMHAHPSPPLLALTLNPTCPLLYTPQTPPPWQVEDCQFCVLSTGGDNPFFSSKKAPLAGTESEFIASCIGCT